MLVSGSVTVQSRDLSDRQKMMFQFQIIVFFYLSKLDYFVPRFSQVVKIYHEIFKQFRIFRMWNHVEVVPATIHV